LVPIICSEWQNFKDLLKIAEQTYLWYWWKAWRYQRDSGKSKDRQYEYHKKEDERT